MQSKDGVNVWISDPVRGLYYDPYEMTSGLNIGITKYDGTHWLIIIYILEPPRVALREQPHSRLSYGSINQPSPSTSFAFVLSYRQYIFVTAVSENC